MRIVLFLLFTGLQWAMLARVMAADAEGRFAVRGAGMVECRVFVEEKRRNTPKLSLYLGWIDGYVSAANQFSSDTFDRVPWGNTVYLATLVESYCNKHPGERFYVAVGRLLENLSKQRLRTSSELVNAEYGGHRTFLYRSVLKAVQARLKEAGHYQGEPDGTYGPATRDALLAFQKEVKTRQTGLPDQLTLYLIDRKLGKLLPHP